MPVYEYRCPHCGSEFERLTSYALADGVACPDCAHAPVQRRVSRVADPPRQGGYGSAPSASASACGPTGSAGGT